MTPRKKLIEVALPLEAINQACVEDKNRKTGHIRNLHKWFAPMPLPAWRATLFASFVDDPGNDLPEQEADLERRRLFKLIERLIPFDAIEDKQILDEAKAEIRKCLGDHLPIITDPFCGGGSTVIEAQRLGLPSFASDLNPIPVLITTLLTAIAPFVADAVPVNPIDGANKLIFTGRLSGFVADVKYYAEYVRKAAWEQIHNLYPLGPGGSTVIAWRWARTVASPDPRFEGIHTPLVTDWSLTKKKSGQEWIEATLNPETKSIEYHIRNKGKAPSGTTGRTAARCLLSNTPIPLAYIREEGKRGRLGLHMLALATVSNKHRECVEPNKEHVDAAGKAVAAWRPEVLMPERALGFRVQEYGLRQFSDLFTIRQITALDTFASCVAETHKVIVQDALNAGREPDNIPFVSGGKGARAYADAITTMLGICIGKLAQSNNTLVRWFIDPRNGSGKATPAFDRHAIPMVWDFVEVNPFGGSTGDWILQIETAIRALALIDPYGPPTQVRQLDARSLHLFIDQNIAVATDPPYFANIGYADISDFFYIWLRRALKEIYPDLFATLATPKASELIATPYRHDGNTDTAKAYFREGFQEVFSNIAKHQRQDIPISIIYAFKQEEDDEAGTASTGWDAMLEGLIASGLSVVGTWPLRTNRATRMIGIGTNALASAILILCRVRPASAPVATRRELVAALKKELPSALIKLQQGNIAPVDFAQAAIGPGMSIFSRHSKVLEANGSSMTVQAGLQIINDELERFLEVLEGEMDRDTRFCITWFEQYGLDDGLFGEADVLARAKNTAVQGLVEAGVIYSKAGKVRLLKRAEYPQQWNPRLDHRVTVWECAQHLIRRLDTGGIEAAARLVNELGGGSEDARALAYRLYSICERKKWADEALAYNTLVVEWPAIQDKAAQLKVMPTTQADLFS